VNGESVPEPSLNAYLAGAFGVPVVMLSGDDWVISEAHPVLGDIEYAQVKRSTGFSSGEHMALADSRRLLRESARRAVESVRGTNLAVCELPVTIEVELSPDPVTDPALGARVDDNQRFIDETWSGAALSDVDLVLATHPQVSSPRKGTIAFTCEDYPSAYATLYSVLGEIYERDIENLIDTVAEPEEYSRPELDDLIGGHPLTEREVAGSR
jgi:hypothetical protein